MVLCRSSALSLKKVFEDELKAISPDIVFTHNRKDAHQDHRLIAELTWNTFRDHLILEYEIPKYDGDLGQPNCFVPLEVRTLPEKDSLHHGCIPVPTFEAVVSRRNFSFSDAFARNGMQLTKRLCRSVLLSKNGFVIWRAKVPTQFAN